MKAHKILVVDDDPHIREVVVFALEKVGMQVVQVENGEQALLQFHKHHPALLVLDINMPEMDGLEVCKKLRQTSDVPVIFLSSRDEDIDRILGIELGGDDYVTKPFVPRELVARVKAVLKRTQGENSVMQEASSDVLQYGDLRLSHEDFTVTWQGKPVVLTALEFRMVENLMRQPSRVFERESLIDGAYKDNIHVSDRTVDSHIRNIRKKFVAQGCDSIIETVRGIGYRLQS